MKKHEFMTRLANELHKRNVEDAADVLEEYEQHFAFKLADGYSEEEIAAKLGVPEELAAQFAPKKKRRLRTPALVSLLLFAVCFVLGYAACALSAGSFQFWHVWGWFRN